MLHHIYKHILCLSCHGSVRFFVERMEDVDIFRLQTVFVIQGLVTCSWGVAVIKDIAHLVRITSVSHPQFSPLLQVLCPPPAHLQSTPNIGNQQHYTLTGGP